MSFLKKVLAKMHKANATDDEHRLKHQLIYSISVELFLFGIILLCVNLYLKFWAIALMLFIGVVLVSASFYLLSNKCPLRFCGYYITSIALLVTILGNLWLGGISTSYFGWFYVAPLLAAVTIGLDGLVVFSLLSAAIIITFSYGQFTPIYFQTHLDITLLNIINHVLIVIIIFSVLYSLLLENAQYKQKMKEQNYLLNADKQKFHYLSHHDSLTNLPNRSYFLSHLQAMIDALNPNTDSLSLYFMDLNEFKKINDQYGHEIGDLLLLQTSKRLQACFRENDFIARLGGDEFTAIITHNNKDLIADVITQRIEKEFLTPFIIKDYTINCNISIGRATYPKDSQHSEVLLKLADEAMYLNKKVKVSAKNHRK